MQKKFFKYVINQIILFIFISLLFSFVFSNDCIAQMKVNERNAYTYNVDTIYNPSTSLIDLIVVEYEKYDICDDTFEPYDKNYNLKSKDVLLSSIKLQTKENDSKI